MKTLRELIEENKDKFATGGFKVRHEEWEDDYWIHILGTNKDCFYGYTHTDEAFRSLISDEDDEWFLHEKPKPKIKLYPYLFWSHTDVGKLAMIGYYKEENKSKEIHEKYFIQKHPTLEPIEIEVHE